MLFSQLFCFRPWALRYELVSYVTMQLQPLAERRSHDPYNKRTLQVLKATWQCGEPSLVVAQIWIRTERLQNVRIFFWGDCWHWQLEAGEGWSPLECQQHDRSCHFSIKINEKRMVSSAPSKKLFYFSYWVQYNCDLIPCCTGDSKELLRVFLPKT